MPRSTCSRLTSPTDPGWCCWSTTWTVPGKRWVRLSSTEFAVVRGQRTRRVRRWQNSLRRDQRRSRGVRRVNRKDSGSEQALQPLIDRLGQRFSDRADAVIKLATAAYRRAPLEAVQRAEEDPDTAADRMAELIGF